MNETHEKIRKEIADLIRDMLQMELLNTGHVASEALFNSIECVTSKTISAFEFTASALYYAPFVNDGRKKGVTGVPLDALISWMRLRKFDLHGAKEASVAFAMQMSIKRKGIKASRFVDRAASKIDKSRRLEQKVEQLMLGFIEARIEALYNKISE